MVGALPDSGLAGSQATLISLKREAARIVEQQPAGQALADAQDLLHHLGRLQRADDADSGTQHADLGAVGDRAGRRRLGEDAAVAGIGLAVGARLVRLQGREIAVERADSGEHQRLPRQIAGIADEIAGGEVVRAVGDDVVAADDIERVAGVEPRLVRLDVHMRIEPGDRLPRALDLGCADVRGVVHDLALQVVERDAIVVDDAEGADAGRGQIHQKRASRARRHPPPARARP